ncbi:unnamed protein product [Trifolium pratense]|uniref:Uncharacterized protein n=1 Tax=Trifolium pratense TaxID=57577 RepID=A0ACB0KX60_TRIPR|nr:unnamed protein product [Trifolium pratense]
MMKKYEMSDLGLLHHFLGIEVYQDEYGVFICQKRYTENILKKFGMYGCKPVDIPLVVNEKLKKENGGRLIDASMYRSLVGSLFYLTTSRPDLMFAATLLSRFMSKPSHLHLGAAKRVLRYVMGTMEYGIRFEKNSKFEAKGYCDSDWAGSVDDMKSTSGYVFNLGSGVISWCSKKQDTVAQSSAEAEYLAAGLATQQSLWLRRILEDIGEKQEGSLQLHCDNKSAIAMAKNLVFHSRTRHINIKHHFIRSVIEEGDVQLIFCSSQEQLADIFTKALPRGRFQQLREAMGVKEQHIKGEYEAYNTGDYINSIVNRQNTEAISNVLHPDDRSHQGKEMRLKQQYFFVSASLQDIIRRFKEAHNNFDELPKQVALHLNDTHPSLSIAEIMRILVDEEHLGWSKAWNILAVNKIFSFTTHTVVAEGLEKIPVDLLGSLLPRHLQLDILMGKARSAGQSADQEEDDETLVLVEYV